MLPVPENTSCVGGGCYLMAAKEVKVDTASHLDFDACRKYRDSFESLVSKKTPVCADLTHFSIFK